MAFNPYATNFPTNQPYNQLPFNNPAYNTTQPPYNNHPFNTTQPYNNPAYNTTQPSYNPSFNSDPYRTVTPQPTDPYRTQAPNYTQTSNFSQPSPNLEFGSATSSVIPQVNYQPKPHPNPSPKYASFLNFNHVKSKNITTCLHFSFPKEYTF